VVFLAGVFLVVVLAAGAAAAGKAIGLRWPVK